MANQAVAKGNSNITSASRALHVLLMRTGGVTKIILCADHFYNKIIACFCAILRIYAPSLEGSKNAFRHELIVFQTSKLAEKAPIQRASCLGSRQDSDYERSSQFEIWLVLDFPWPLMRVHRRTLVAMDASWMRLDAHGSLLGAPGGAPGRPGGASGRSRASHDCSRSAHGRLLSA